MTDSRSGRETWSVFRGDALDAYRRWPTPAAIISDGAYGVGGFPGDPRTADDLADWYAPHVESWLRLAAPSSTLWFWNTELGWANVHPLLAKHGWEYVQTIVWDKGIAHIAGNVNSETIRQFPVVSEICVFYRRRLEFADAAGRMTPAKKWLRDEWRRAGLPLYMANQACGVANAATRKYLTQDWLWYLPPPEKMELLVGFANRHRDPEGAPYYSLDGISPVTADEWAALRDRWNHTHGLTNVWSAPPLNGRERYKGNGVRSAPRVHRPGPNASVHLNQKPLDFMRRIITAATSQSSPRPPPLPAGLEFMRRIITAATQSGDAVWEPFGGLCSAVVAAVKSGRRGFAAEPVEHFADLAIQRIENADPRSRLAVRA